MTNYRDLQSIIGRDVVPTLQLARTQLMTVLGSRNIERVAIWGCAETGQVIADLLSSAGISVNAAYDSFREGRFRGLEIRHPSDGFDPMLPVVIASGRRRDELDDVVKTLETAGVPYFFCDGYEPDSLSIEILKNCHAGQRCFVVGNGPSLNAIDLSPLRHEITLGSNRVYMGFERWGFQFNYWAIEDRLVGEDIADEWNALSGPIKFVPRDMASMVTNHKELCWVDFRRNSFSLEGPDFNDGTANFYWGGTVTYLLLQLAAYMGCNPIYLIGVDFNYQRPDHVRELSVPSQWISGGDDPNHFDPNYFGKGRKWHDPDVDRMGQAYGAAKRFGDQRGLVIKNATPGSRLEVFPKVDYADLFDAETVAADQNMKPSEAKAGSMPLPKAEILRLQRSCAILYCLQACVPDSSASLSVVEIGTMFKEDEGLSTLLIAEHLSRCASKAKLISIDYNGEHIAASQRIVSRYRPGLLKNNLIEWRFGNSLQILSRELDDLGSLMFCLLDGSGSPEVNLREFEMLLDRARPETLFLVDDTTYLAPSAHFPGERDFGKGQMILSVLLLARSLAQRTERATGSVAREKRIEERVSAPNPEFFSALSSAVPFQAYLEKFVGLDFIFLSHSMLLVGRSEKISAIRAAHGRKNKIDVEALRFVAGKFFD